MKITEIMDSYTDNEFLIEGEQSADFEKILQGVNAKVKVKKHLRLHTKIIIAVAAAFIGIFAITAATRTTTFVTRLNYLEEWNILSGSYPGITFQNAYDRNTFEPYRIDNGRVIFTAVDEGKSEIDITDMISDEKAFYYEYNKEDSTGKVHKCIIAVGGALDDLGYGEMIFNLGNHDSVTTMHAIGIHNTYYLIDGKEVLEKDLTEEQYNDRKTYTYRSEEKGWYKEFCLKGPQKMSDEEMIKLGVDGAEE